MNVIKKTLLAVSFLGLAATASAAMHDGEEFGQWRASCQTVDGNDVCGVIQVADDKDNKPVARVILRKLPQAKNNVTMIITLPLGVNLQAGVGIAVDGSEIGRMPYAFCDEGGCNVAAPLEKEVLSKIKAGKELQIAAFIADEQQTVPFSLIGVTKAINAL